jgi:hypothetical protein
MVKVIQLVKCIQRDFPDQFNATVGTLPAEDSVRFQQAFLAA